MPELRTDIEIIVADVSIEESLTIMCQQGLVVLNCVGPVSMSSRFCPGLKQRGYLTALKYYGLCCVEQFSVCSLSFQYRFYGEPVVKACIENGAHYIDICGEPQVGK